MLLKLFSLPAVVVFFKGRNLSESINFSYEANLASGINFERRKFHSLFSTEDQKEGMAAFVEKRTPKFTDR